MVNMQQMNSISSGHVINRWPNVGYLLRYLFFLFVTLCFIILSSYTISKLCPYGHRQMINHLSRLYSTGKVIDVSKIRNKINILEIIKALIFNKRKMLKMRTGQRAAKKKNAIFVELKTVREPVPLKGQL